MPVRHIIHLLQTAIRGPIRTPLGRWNVDNYRQTTLKIQYANEDNCGTCGGYNIHNTKQTQIIANYESHIGLYSDHHYDDDDDDDHYDQVYVHMMGLDTVPSAVYTRHK